jgi:hypothetical protein
MENQPVPTEDVRYTSDGCARAGTYIQAAALVAAALLITGSGRTNRNSDARLPFRQTLRSGITKAIAEALDGAQISTLRYDKRGTGASGGDYLTTGLAQQLSDARAGRFRSGGVPAGQHPRGGPSPGAEGGPGRRAAARERAWALAGRDAPGGDGGLVTVDLDATIVIARSEKQEAASTWKRPSASIPSRRSPTTAPPGTSSPSRSCCGPGAPGPTRPPTASAGI